MNIILKLIVGTLCVLGLLFLGAVLFAPSENVATTTTTTTETMNSPAEAVAAEQTTSSPAPIAEQTGLAPEPAAETQTTNSAAPTTYVVGDTVTDGKTNIVVNSVRTTTRIDEKNNEFSVADAQSGYEYVILDVTIENVGSDTASYSPIINFKVYDSSGYSYSDDFTAETALSKPFDGNNVVPGSKRRGEVPFMVPTDAQGLQLQFSFEAFGTDVAIINLE